MSWIVNAMQQTQFGIPSWIKWSVLTVCIHRKNKHAYSAINNTHFNLGNGSSELTVNGFGVKFDPKVASRGFHKTRYLDIWTMSNSSDWLKIWSVLVLRGQKWPQKPLPRLRMLLTISLQYDYFLILVSYNNKFGAIIGFI